MRDLENWRHVHTREYMIRWFCSVEGCNFRCGNLWASSLPKSLRWLVALFCQLYHFLVFVWAIRRGIRCHSQPNCTMTLPDRTNWIEANTMYPTQTGEIFRVSIVKLRLKSFNCGASNCCNYDCIAFQKIVGCKTN